MSNIDLHSVALDANGLYCDLKSLTQLLNIVIDDFEDNGENEARRKLTQGELYIIHGQTSHLADMQGELAGKLERLQREGTA